VLNANPSGGSGTGYTFSWTGPGGFTSTSQSPTVTTPGSYTVTVTDSNGCTGSACSVVGLCLGGSCAGPASAPAQPKARKSRRRTP
jgi:hypothetical protein